MNTRGFWQGFWRSVLVLIALMAISIGMTSIVYPATADAYFLDPARVGSRPSPVQ